VLRETDPLADVAYCWSPFGVVISMIGLANQLRDGSFF
jgi:hypothetical protein